eukprot:4188850-Amphidinium_carterae.1
MLWTAAKGWILTASARTALDPWMSEGCRRIRTPVTNEDMKEDTVDSKPSSNPCAAFQSAKFPLASTKARSEASGMACATCSYTAATAKEKQDDETRMHV